MAVIRKNQVKKFKHKTKLKPEEVELLTVRYFRCLRMNNFKIFAQYCKVFNEKTGKTFNFHPSLWTEPQRQFQENRCGKDIVLKPRRIGFTTLELCRDLFYALTHPGSTTVIVAQEDKMASRALNDIRKYINGIETLAKSLTVKGVTPKMIPDRTIDSVHQIQFDNGADIVCEVAKNHEYAADRTGRGLSIKRLHCTEVAFWTYGEQVMTSLLTAASNAEEIVIESTPNGASGYFYDFFWKVEQGNVPTWKNHFYPWHCMKEYRRPLGTRAKHPDHAAEFMVPLDQFEETLINKFKIDANQLQWWREKTTELKLNSVIQEFPIDIDTCFRSKSTTFLDGSCFIFLESCIKPPEFKQTFLSYPDVNVNIWHRPESNKRYIIGVDCAYGKGLDYSSFYVIEYVSGKICASFACNKIKPATLGHLLKEVAISYNKALLAIESIGPGMETIHTLEMNGYLNMYKMNKDSKDYGWHTTAASRVRLFNLYQTMAETKSIEFVDHELVSEARTLVFKDGRVDHIKGAYSDRTIAFLIAQCVRESNPRTTLLQELITVGQRAQMNHGFSFGRPRF